MRWGPSIALWGFRAGAAVVPLLPARVLEPLTAALAEVAYRANRPGRAAVRANLRIVLGVEPAPSQVRAVFRTAVENYADLFRLPRYAPADLTASIELVGLEHLAAALGAGRGALLASLHLGNIEVVGYAAAAQGYRLVLPVERLEPPELLDLMVRLRERAGFSCVPVGKHAFGQVRAALATNAIVGLGVDRLTTGGGEWVTFCGRLARLPVAAAILALRTGAPLLPIGTTRLPDHRFRVRIGSPVAVPRSGRLREDARRLTEQLLDQLGGYLRENPTQWAVFRDIWDTSAADEDRLGVSV
jgi:lauroyl/myristoyl acyltransferase